MTISQQLENYTAENSRAEASRNYISLSHSHLTVEEIIHNVKNGFSWTHESKLRCYKGYQMEDDLKRRIINVFGDRVIDNIEVSAFDGRVQGHPDFTFDGFPSDCKTLPLDEHLPVGNRVSRKIFAQMQAYMLYMKKQRALLIYESRETGRIVDIWLNASFRAQQEIDNKFKKVISLL